MILKNKERGAAFAWQVMKTAPYATLSLTDADGRPYAVPISQGAWAEKNSIYFHCAFAGQKYEIFKDGCEAAVSAVSRAETIPEKYNVSYASAVARGRLEIITDEAERMQAIECICRQFGADTGKELTDCMKHSGGRTCLVRLTVEEITGKEG